MKKLYLICDESGSKGFAENKEQFDGEFGVFAGYFLTTDNFDKCKGDFEAIYKKYSSDGGKLHITDLSSATQESLRNEVFEYLVGANIHCAYEAISVHGYNREFNRLNEIKSKQSEELKEKLSFSKNMEKERLHSELFQALFGKAVAFSMDKGIGTEIRVQVITDRIEATLKKEFEAKAEELLRPFPSEKKITAFDKEAKQPVSKTIRFETKNLNDEISKAEFEIVVQDDALTLIADIIANSIAYYLKQAVTTNPNVTLNSAEGIKGHPLLPLFYGLSTDTTFNIVSDKIYGRNE